MRAYIISLFFLASVILVCAEERPWHSTPYINNSVGPWCITVVQQYWVAVWSNWGEISHPDLPSAWSRAFTNYSGTLPGPSSYPPNPPYSAPWIPPPEDANTMQPPGISDGTNYYITYELPSLTNTYPYDGSGGYNVYDDVGYYTVWYSTNGPPDTNYYCYFDLEGVFYSEDPSGYMTALLWVQAPEYVFVNLANYTISESGAYTKSYGPYPLDQTLAYLYKHYWNVFISSSSGASNKTYHLDGPEMSGSYENNHHYLTKFDFTIFNTNAPYIPDVPTNMPPQYPDYPGPWDTNTYGPCPPYYSPWPPDYPPPPPLTNWPSTPPPNWPYNTNSPYNPDQPPSPTPDPNNPTNYSDPTPAYTNGGVSYSLSQWYSMFRDALRDAGNEVDYAVPAQYQFAWSNTIAPQLSQLSDFHAVGVSTLSNVNRLVQSSVQKVSALNEAFPTLQSLEPLTSLDLGEIPMFGSVSIDLSQFSTPITLFRNILKLGLYLSSVLYAIAMIRKALSRGGD